MVNWRQRELEWARTAAMFKERQLRELKEQAETEHEEHEETDAHDVRHRHAAKRGKSHQ